MAAPKTLTKKQEARLAPVIEAFPERATAVAYARKLIKVELKLRTSPPPRNDLTDDEIAKIRELLGMVAKTPAA